MPSHRFVESSDDEAPGPAAPKAQSKPPRTSQDDFSGNGTFPHRTRERQPSKKQDQNGMGSLFPSPYLLTTLSYSDKENLDAAQKRFEKA